MAGTYSDQEIAALLQERKPLPADWHNQIRLRPKRGHEERDLELSGDGGGEFRLILRQNRINPLDFSIILAVRVPTRIRSFGFDVTTARATSTPISSKTRPSTTSIFTWPRSATRRSVREKTPTRWRPAATGTFTVPCGVSSRTPTWMFRLRRKAAFSRTCK